MYVSHVVRLRVDQMVYLENLQVPVGESIEMNISSEGNFAAQLGGWMAGFYREGGDHSDVEIG